MSKFNHRTNLNINQWGLGIHFICYWTWWVNESTTLVYRRDDQSIDQTTGRKQSLCPLLFIKELQIVFYSRSAIPYLFFFQKDQYLKTFTKLGERTGWSILFVHYNSLTGKDGDAYIAIKGLFLLNACNATSMQIFICGMHVLNREHKLSLYWKDILNISIAV